jgi:hypothetical protein
VSGLAGGCSCPLTPWFGWSSAAAVSVPLWVPPWCGRWGLWRRGAAPPHHGARPTLLSAQVTARRLLAGEGPPVLHWSARRMPSTHLLLAGSPFFAAALIFPAATLLGMRREGMLLSSIPRVLATGIDCCGGFILLFSVSGEFSGCPDALYSLCRHVCVIPRVGVSYYD